MKCRARAVHAQEHSASHTKTRCRNPRGYSCMTPLNGRKRNSTREGVYTPRSIFEVGLVTPVRYHPQIAWLYKAPEGAAFPERGQGILSVSSQALAGAAGRGSAIISDAIPGLLVTLYPIRGLRH